MGWSKREAVSNLVVLGDDEGTVKKVGGLLAAVNQDTVYAGRMNYELVQKNGESIMLAGSASLGRQIGPTDVGKFLKAEFIGWGKSANGKFKEIAVYIWDGEPNDDMKKWPRFAEFQKNGARAKAEQIRDKIDEFADMPEPLKVEDDDLPF
jgi:hypothetical protein